MATFRSEKRKKALRERRRVQEGGVTFRTLHGSDMTPALWKVVFGFSAATFESRGHEHYLNEDFFRAVSRALPDSVMVKLAVHEDRPIASAIFFRSDDTLYGRYWGAAADFHSLHFETCYYQGIEYCIERGLRHFEPGTQGEHKVPRGFEPTATWSAHWIADPRFRRAIDQYLAQERAGVDEYMRSVREHLPFRRDDGDGPAGNEQSDNAPRTD
jgi:predicted N-acyltransferase